MKKKIVYIYKFFDKFRRLIKFFLIYYILEIAYRNYPVFIEDLINYRNR